MVTVLSTMQLQSSLGFKYRNQALRKPRAWRHNTQTSKQTNKQASKQTNKQPNKQTNTQTHQQAAALSH
jgi:hypothetical protein